MFEDYTYEALLADVLANAPAGIDTRQGSIFYDAVSGIVLKIAKMYTDIDQVFQYVFIATATGEYLDMKASEYGMERSGATPTQYYFQYEGATPPIGARFFHNESGKYFTLGSGDDTLILIAEEAGTVGNDVPSGDLAVPVNTIEGLTASSFGAIYESGTNEEDDEHLRVRLQEKIAGPAENGNKQHYKTWCEGCDENIGIARITPLWNGPNTVKAVLITPEGKPCEAATVLKCQNVIDPAKKGMTTVVDGKTYVVGDGLGEGLANLGAHFTATAADKVDIYVSFTAILANGKTAEDAEKEAHDKVEAYLKELVLNTVEATDIVVRVTAIGAMIASCESVLDYSNLLVNGGTGNIFPGSDGVPVVPDEGVTVNVDVQSVLEM